MVLRFLVTALSKIDPRRLVPIAALLVAAGSVMTYVSVGDRADRLLALRQGPPSPVSIQNFEALYHEGPASEVVVWAEADLDAPLVLTLRGSKPKRTFHAYPLYPVSDSGAASIMAATGRSKGTVGVHAARRAEVPPNRRVALGILVFETGRRNPNRFDPRDYVDVLGEGRHGAALEVTGESVDAGDLILMVDGALSVENAVLADSHLTVAPYMDGRLAALRRARVPQPSGLVFFWTAFAVTLGGLFLSLLSHGERDPRRLLLERERASAGARRAAPPRQAHFDQLRSQEEVDTADEAERAARPPSLSRRLIWGSLAALGTAVVAGARLVLASLQRVRSPR